MGANLSARYGALVKWLKRGVLSAQARVQFPQASPDQFSYRNINWSRKAVIKS